MIELLKGFPELELGLGTTSLKVAISQYNNALGFEK